MVIKWFRRPWFSVRHKTSPLYKTIIFPVPSRDVTNQTLPGREKFNYSRPGRGLVSDIPAGDRENDILFLQCTSINLPYAQKELHHCEVSAGLILQSAKEFI